jgi:hypothetical protein
MGRKGNYCPSGGTKKELYSFKKFREREIAFIQIIDEKGSTIILVASKKELHSFR